MGAIADLKRNLTKETEITLTYAKLTHEGDERLNKPRYVVKTQGNGVYLAFDKNATRGAFLEFPKASLSEYNETSGELTIYEAGYRALTEKEKEVLANEPRGTKEQQESDLIADTNFCYWQKKQYYNTTAKEYAYLSGWETFRGKYRTNNCDKAETPIKDDEIKGEIVLKYKIRVGKA